MFYAILVAVLVAAIVLFSLYIRRNPYDELPALAPFGVESLQTVIYLVLRVLAYRACIKENGVGVISRVAQVVARHLHDRGDHLAVGDIHLASVCLDKESLHF